MLVKMNKENSIEYQEIRFLQFMESCRDAGLKVTHQRIEIFKALMNSADHPTVEMLHKRITEKVPSISLDTVYRTLATFEQHNLISRINTSSSLARFEVKQHIHHHLICSNCNIVIDFDWPVFDRIDLPESITELASITSKNVVIYGTCKNCLNNK
jgi:Fur family transcriptional regulator, peroxide stress response regulator